jgi:hypothetical protein
LSAPLSQDLELRLLLGCKIGLINVEAVSRQENVPGFIDSPDGELRLTWRHQFVHQHNVQFSAQSISDNLSHIYRATRDRQDQRILVLVISAQPSSQ